MVKKALRKQILGVGLLLLSGCDVAHSARNDLAKLFDSRSPTSRPNSSAPSTRTAAARTDNARKADAATDRKSPIAEAPPADATGEASPILAGKSEGDLRALLGPPSSEEDRAPGKIWRYRDGRCTLNIQLYPDVQTHQFGTLAYEVRSDDNTDEGKRLCVAQLRSRTQAAR